MSFFRAPARVKRTALLAGSVALSLTLYGDQPPSLSTLGGVATVDLSQAPQKIEFGSILCATAEEEYPKIIAMLGADKQRVPKKIRIVIVPPSSRAVGVGKESRGTIWINAGFVHTNSSNLQGILVHEMAHAVQDYKSYWWRNTPSYWTEGIADFVRFKLGYFEKCQCDSIFGMVIGNYSQGYQCAAAFLVFLENGYPGIVRELNGRLRKGRYQERFFTEFTGKNLAELWQEFKNRPKQER